MAYLPICMLLIWAFFPETYPQEVKIMTKHVTPILTHKINIY